MRNVSVENFFHHFGNMREWSKAKGALDDVRRVLFLRHREKVAQKTRLDDGIPVVTQNSRGFNDVLNDVVGEFVRSKLVALD